MFSMIKKLWERLTKDPVQEYIDEHNLKVYDRLKDDPDYVGEETDEGFIPYHRDEETD